MKQKDEELEKSLNNYSKIYKLIFKLFLKIILLLKLKIKAGSFSNYYEYYGENSINKLTKILLSKVMDIQMT